MRVGNCVRWAIDFLGSLHGPTPRARSGRACYECLCSHCEELRLRLWRKKSILAFVQTRTRWTMTRPKKSPVPTHTRRDKDHLQSEARSHWTCFLLGIHLGYSTWRWAILGSKLDTLSKTRSPALVGALLCSVVQCASNIHLTIPAIGHVQPSLTSNSSCSARTTSK